MSETKMPAAEAEAVVETDEVMSYELAFHVLPTVAEGEVPAVFDAIKAAIVTAEGKVFDEEAAKRFELAYEIVQNIEGKNRKFATAYFGWIRFKAPATAVAAVTEAVTSNENVLRHLLIRLTRVEEENPFRFHDALGEQKVTTVEEKELVAEAKEEAPAAAAEEPTEATEEKKEEA